MQIDRLRRAAGQPPAPVRPPEASPPAAPTPIMVKEATPDAALQLLSLLQRDARLIDFTMENLAGYSDADIGAAARVVHEGCRKVLNEHFTIDPVRTETEGNRITLNEGFDGAAIRLTGNVVGARLILIPANNAALHSSREYRRMPGKSKQISKSF
jgi:hypothetical protein